MKIEEVHIDLKPELHDEVPYFEDKFLDEDAKFIINLNRCIDYLSHMKLKSDIIDNKVDEIIYKFNKKWINNIMKLTKTELKNIIKESVKDVLYENKQNLDEISINAKRRNE